MYIQEIIVDGFKSYANKTVIAGWDPQFNAITGLNGTGKSNILDSICFVLGISALAQVRVGNLQELVYKQGQAGVTKASVTIIFNNGDVSSSPVGYEQHKEITVTRQVVIGGKNKYMINGHTVQQSQVQNMFHSVQLNVNNPHFLIMQGRITKVLSMKPVETLSMIEEAAGTRMFEDKKQAAQKTIMKKQMKVDEITKCMEEEITPTLDGLRTERQDYHTWQSNNTEFERLDRFCIAYDYKVAEERVLSSEEDKKALEHEHEQYMSLIEQKKALASEWSKKINDIEYKRDSEIEGSVDKLKHIQTEVSKTLVKANTLYINHEETSTREKEALGTLTKRVEEEVTMQQQKKKELADASAQLKAKELDLSTAEQAHNILNTRYQNACAGVADETTAELLSLPEQVATWEKKEREALSKMQQCQQQSDHAKKSRNELLKSSQTDNRAHTAALKEMDRLKTAIASAEARISNIASTEQDESTLRSRVTELRTTTSTLKDQIDHTSAGLEARLAFEFRDPERGFDRSRVKGLVARLVRVQDPKACTALEIAAGAKLYQVVVDTEQTGKLILQNGQLRRRVTILPLNKINARCTDATKLAKAKSLATNMGGEAHLAIELVGYDKEIEKAVQYVFGSTIICNKADIAKTIAFDKSIRNPTVTLEGDSYDPSGTLTGGSKNNLGVLLGKIEELSALQAKLQEQETDLHTIQKQLIKVEKDMILIREQLAIIDKNKYALQLCEQQVAGSTYALSLAQIGELKRQLEGFDENVQSLKVQHDKAKSELKKLKQAESGMKNQREALMKNMEREVKVSQKGLSALKGEVFTLTNRRNGIDAAMQAGVDEVAALQGQVEVANQTIEAMTKEGLGLAARVNALHKDHEEAKKATEVKQQELNQSNKAIKAAEKEREVLLKEAQTATLEGRKVEHKMNKWDKEFKEAQSATNRLLKTHHWIETEKQFFGQVGSDFDFAVKELNECKKRLSYLKADQDRLNKKINKKVMGMIENAESEYEELSRKKGVVLNDKAKIEKVISELEVKKTQALNTTWIKVNRDFGSIFAMLLPGCHAKLEPPEGCCVNDGLEVKVAFNGIWKESLTELSGGQRSLLALSLILSLLLFKPAPMYILDEVDAALDLNHTQNIGMMLRTHFKNSQFIVVSLKEGMFNNANVIFRTKFVDGVSAVVRTVAGGSRVRGVLTVIPHTTQDEPSNSIRAEDADLLSPEKKRGKKATKASKNRGAGIVL